MAKKFSSEFDPRGTVKVTDKLMIQNIDTGNVEFCTVAELLASFGLTTLNGNIGIRNTISNIVALFSGVSTITPLSIVGGIDVGRYWRESFIGANIDLDATTGKPKTVADAYRGSAIGFNSDGSQGNIHFFTAVGSTAGTILEERMTIDEYGNVIIGGVAATAKLQVVGLAEYADNATASGAGLTVGAFYRTGDLLKVVH